MNAVKQRRGDMFVNVYLFVFEILCGDFILLTVLTIFADTTT